MKNFNSNIVLKEIRDYCSTHLCRDCKFVNADWTCPFCKGTNGTIPSCWEFENSKQVREANRRAREGEYIKIVNADAMHAGYDNGDIAKVTSRFDSDAVRIDKENSGCVLDSEYIVLENYVPDKKETVPSAGDTERGNCENVREKTIAQPKGNVNTSLVEMSPDGDLIIHPAAAAYVKVLQDAVSKALDGGAK